MTPSTSRKSSFIVACTALSHDTSSINRSRVGRKHYPRNETHPSGERDNTDPLGGGMAQPKRRSRKYSAEEQKLIEQTWASLEAELDREMKILRPSRLRVGQILYEMKLWLKKYGLNQGRKGRWKSVCERHKFDRKTAENWIRLYQEEGGVPAHKWVVAPTKKSQRNSKNNTVKATGLDGQGVEVPEEKSPAPRIVAADEREADKSPQHRLPVGCIFVMTLAEKLKFMHCVKRLGELRATQLMYSAVVSATEGES